MTCFFCRMRNKNTWLSWCKNWMNSAQVKKIQRRLNQKNCMKWWLNVQKRFPMKKLVRSCNNWKQIPVWKHNISNFACPFFQFPDEKDAKINVIEFREALRVVLNKYSINLIHYLLFRALCMSSWLVCLPQGS